MLVTKLWVRDGRKHSDSVDSVSLWAESGMCDRADKHTRVSFDRQRTSPINSQHHLPTILEEMYMHGRGYVVMDGSSSTSPYAHDTVFSSFGEIAVLDSDSLHGSRRTAIFFCSHAWPTVPMTTIRFIIHLCYILTSCADDSSSIELHAGDGKIISICIMDRSRPKIPNLRMSARLCSSMP
jgi:hypothetical protein